MKSFAHYETPSVTRCFNAIAFWADHKIDALRNAEMSAEAAKAVNEIIVALHVEMTAHMGAFAQMAD